MNEWLYGHLACPRDKTPLVREDQILICTENHSYNIVEGVPILMFDDGSPTHGYIRKTLDQVARIKAGTSADEVFRRNGSANGAVDQFVQAEIPYTCGNLYFSVQNKLTRYPFPELRLPDGNGKRLLDLGCNWGRWTVVAQQKGYLSVGLDPSLEAILAARRVARQSGVEPDFVVADARYLPFAEDAFDTVFSYSVLQHLKKENVRTVFDEISRVTNDGGNIVIQMPNRYGLRCLYHQVRLGFKDGREGSDVFYWTPDELLKAFTKSFGETDITVDCFFGLNIQRADIDLLPLTHRAVIHTSEFFRDLSRRIPLLVKCADSLYVASVNEKTS